MLTVTIIIQLALERRDVRMRNKSFIAWIVLALLLPTVLAPNTVMAKQSSAEYEPSDVEVDGVLWKLVKVGLHYLGYYYTFTRVAGDLQAFIHAHFSGGTGDGIWYEPSEPCYLMPACVVEDGWVYWN